MFLCIAFAGEAIPFVMHDADEVCLRAIAEVKKKYRFNRATAVVTPDRVYLEAWPLEKPCQHRLYIYRDRVILRTGADCTDEVDATKGLLAYERNCTVAEIQCIEV